MALVEIGRLALVTHVGHKCDLILEVVGAVVKHRSAQRHYDHLQDPSLPSGHSSPFIWLPRQQHKARIPLSIYSHSILSMRTEA